MTKVKICGITNYDDALLAVKYGVDELGFNFYEKSPRYVTPEMASKMIHDMPSRIGKVGVFVNSGIENIAEIAKMCGLTAIQLHGDEDEQFVDAIRSRTQLFVIKALRIGLNFDVEQATIFKADAILLDAFSPAERGGTGETFDWTVASEIVDSGIVVYLAGGLSADNVADAIEQVRPFAVDACSKLELSPGKKDAKQMKTFIAAVRNSI
ncbi:MAG: phosphoribosylanthranilate isomerase [Blastocatellia bacterium]|jgi:phosphoribosylanthranilate isomerase|nr:phosphoribosylanthranilate isomerase [Blastocatellia bacterium]